MDYLKTIVPSQFLAERGSNLVVINPGSANIRIGLARQDAPLNVPHCIARRTTGANQFPKKNVLDQGLNSQVTTAQHMEREKAYDIIASLLKIPFLDEEVTNNAFPRKMGRIDVYPPQTNKKETAFSWTDVYEKTIPSSASEFYFDVTEDPLRNDQNDESSVEKEGHDYRENNSSEPRYRECIFGEEALRISPTEPYCLRRPIRRGHLNISQYYPMQQVLEDLHVIWDWILTEKLHIPLSERTMFSAILVLPETFDNREVKEMLSIVLRDLHFSSAVVHQEGLAAAFGNGMSTACIINLGAQVTSVICVEDGAVLPTTQMTLRYGGEDISRCLLWTQRHHQTWPPVRTDALTKPVDLLMLNRLRESHCSIREGELETVAVVHSYEDGMPPGSHKTRLTALNVPPMGLFYPMLLVPDVYPPPPRTWFKDYDDMLEDTWHTEGFFPSGASAFPMWESYPIFQARPKKEDNIGLAEAITKSILSTGRIDLQRKLFCSMQLIGGVALIDGLIPAMEERVLHAIPPNEAIDTVEVLQSRTNPTFVAWKGGAILGVLDFSRDAWIHREDWIRSGIHIGSGRKYKDSYFLQAQAMCYINS
ncbi:actin-related protein 9 isoform X1 [Coffea eugenioides]|uniref:Actin-related protein 9 n=1 Tax=Coffea arabica TaxID=13443 RepID=A0A6P6WSG8_COFAR|nr:actin-related protein 9 isoform X1 [Coffea arabica]XP_027166780.1 actin-related protein 9 isoform X1 [Coffea eugenioides]